MRTLLIAIFDTSNSVHEEVFAVRSTEASNLCSRNGHGLTKTAGEAAIQAFIREGWLEKSRNGFITVTERALLELKGYVMEMFNDIDDDGEEGGRVDKMRTCNGCQEIVTKVCPLSVVTYSRVNDVRRYDVLLDSIITVPLTFSLLEIMVVQLVRRHGKIICQLVKRLVLIERGEECRIDGKMLTLKHPSLEGVAVVLHLVRGEVVLPLSVLAPLLQEETERLREGQGEVHPVERVQPSLFKKRRRRKKKRKKGIFKGISYIMP
jgi:hypothetical protein